MANLHQQLRELSMTVKVLVDMLAEAGVLDRDDVQRRVDAERERAQKDVSPIPDPWTPAVAEHVELTGDPYRGMPRNESMVMCVACTRTVAERLTVITEQGVICDVCAARRPPPSSG